MCYLYRDGEMGCAVTTVSRRTFLQGSGALVGGALALTSPAVAAAAKAAQKAFASKARFKALLMPEATVLEAIAAQIIPTDDTPGAREAGVIYFFDQALATFMSGAAGFLRDGLDEFNVGVSERFPGSESFLALEPAQQVDYLKTREQTPFFQTVRFLTLAGMFALSKYGGNRDQAGWKLIGFDHRHVWRPPFGHYDAEYYAKQAAERDD